MHKILVIEDYADNMNLIEEILEDEDYQVYKAEDAEQGLSLLEDNDVSLILMDVSLPKMSGLEATRIIKSSPKLKDIPVVALTAHAMQQDRDAALGAGCSAYLTKPINEELLLQTISDILEQSIKEEIS